MTQHGQPALGKRLDALSQLVSESIAISEIVSTVDVSTRQHVAKALAFPVEHDGQTKKQRHQ